MSEVVIGSGPAGVAAAHALVSAGRKVIVLDAGDRIEPGAMEAFDALSQLEPGQWPPELDRRVRGTFTADTDHVPLKPAYGSLFPYAQKDPDMPVCQEGTEVWPSLAYGGLSNSWGASILPFRQRDLGGWPISAEDLKEHYEAVLRVVPIAAERDELSGILPLYTDVPGELRRSPQMSRLLAHLRRHTHALHEAGLTFGASRLAVETSTDDPRRCRYCGLCLYGCPYGSIYNSSQTLRDLTRTRQIDYRAGVYVDRLTRTDGSVAVTYHERGDPNATGQLTAARVFVACGSISSTRLMLASTGRSQAACSLHDSQYFLTPMATHPHAPVSTETQGNTLAQIFIELERERISRHTVHLQVYGYNDIVLTPLARRLHLGAERLERMLGPLLGRLVIVQGYLHSGDSPGLEVKLEGDRVRLIAVNPAAGASRARSVVRYLAGIWRYTGMLPLPGLLQIGRPGKGNHLGGSFPMSRKPNGLQTDTLGRLPGWERVHIVDASVFPTVPATTVTLSVMANAHRIATAVASTAP
jgi:choline dehydrogenase-like flavoprotein